MKIYLIGSLRNNEVPLIGKRLRDCGFDIFDDWFSAGERADDSWKEYEIKRGRNYSEALEGFAAKHVFQFDKYHLDTSNAGILVLPAGKSGHLELGYLAGQGKPTFILMPQVVESELRWDVMYQFATRVCFDVDELENELLFYKINQRNI
jgi:hypothetical protein